MIQHLDHWQHSLGVSALQWSAELLPWCLCSDINPILSQLSIMSVPRVQVEALGQGWDHFQIFCHVSTNKHMLTCALGCLGAVVGTSKLFSFLVWFWHSCCPRILCRSRDGGFLEAPPGVYSHHGLNAEVCWGKCRVFYAAWPQPLGVFLGMLNLWLWV